MALDKFPIDQYLNDIPRYGRPPIILIENQQIILKEFLLFANIKIIYMLFEM